MSWQKDKWDFSHDIPARGFPELAQCFLFIGNLHLIENVLYCNISNNLGNFSEETLIIKIEKNWLSL